jgi:hypothetical protein
VSDVAAAAAYCYLSSFPQCRTLGLGVQVTVLGQVVVVVQGQTQATLSTQRHRSQSAEKTLGEDRRLRDECRLLWRRT